MKAIVLFAAVATGTVLAILQFRGMRDSLARILSLQELIMGNLAQLETKVGQLEAALQEEHRQITEAIAELKSANQALQDMLSEAGHDQEQIDAITQRVEQVIQDLSGIIPDEPTLPEDPTAG